MNLPEPAALAKIRRPAGDCITVASYREYVERVLGDDLTCAEVRELLTWFRCGIEELTDRIIEQRLVGKARH